MKMCVMIAAVLSMLGQVGCVASREHPVSLGVLEVVPTEPCRLTDGQIAEAVRNSYQSIGFMKSEIDLSQRLVAGDITKLKVKGGHDQIKVVNISARNATKTAVYNVDKPGSTWMDKLIIGFSVYNGSLQEYYPNELRPYNEYPSPYPSGTNQPQGYVEQNCLIGLWTFSWVGVTPNSDLPPPLDIGEYFHNVIGRSVRDPELEAEAKKMGKDYIVFHKGKDSPANEQIVYIGRRKFEDGEVFLVEKWDTIEKSGETDAESIVRARDITYHVISREVPADINWKLWDSSLLSKQ